MSEVGDLVVKIGANVEGFSEAVEHVPEKFLEILDEIDPIIGAITTAIVGIGGAALAVGIEYDEAFDTIIAKTGATGSKLDDLKERFETVFTSVPGSAQDIAGSLSLVSDRLNLTGQSLEELTDQLAKLSSFSGADLVPLTDAVTKAFQNWNVATEDQKAALDLLNSIAQATGTTVTSLAGSMASVGNLARLSGETFAQTAEQIGQLAAKGVDAGDMFQAIARGIGVAQKAGSDLSNVTLPNLVYSIEQGIKSGNGLNVALDEFGVRAGPKMYELVKDGIISSAQLMKTSLDAGTDSINKTYTATDDLGRQFSVLGKNLMSFLEPLGSWLATGAKNFLSLINDAATGFSSLQPKIEANTPAVAKLQKTFLDGKINIEEYSKSLEEAGNKTAAAAAKSLDLGITIVGLNKGLVDVAAQEAAAKERTDLLTEAVKILSDADKQHAENLKATHIPALLDLATAQERVTNYQKAAVETDLNLTQAEQNLRALIDSHKASNVQLKDAEDAVTLAKESAKTANDDLAEAQKDLTNSKAADVSITNLLKSAQEALADTIRADQVPAMLSIIQAESAVNSARENTRVAIQQEQDAIKALSDFQNQTGFKDEALEAQLKANLVTATTNLTAARKNEAKAISDGNSIKQAAKALDSDILQNTRLLDSFLRDNLIGTNKNLLDSMLGVQAAQSRQISAWAALKTALQQENDLKSQGAVDTQAYSDAINNARSAADAYRGATDDLNVAVGNAAQQFGLSRDAIRVLTASISGAVVDAQTLQSAYNVLGIHSAESLAALAQAAQAAYDAIAASGKVSSQELIQAQISVLQSQIAAWEEAGKTVPAAQQIMLAQLEQQERDFRANSVTRWTDLYNTIHDTFTGMWTGLTKDFFEGGDFLDTVTKSLQHVGESILNTLLKPFTDQIDKVLTDVLTKLTSKFSDWLSGILGDIIPGAGGVLGTGVGAASGAGGSAAGAAGQAGSAAGSAGGSAAGAAASGLTGILTSVFTGISAITGILGLFGVGQGGQKDRLSDINNGISYLAWAYDAGGIHVAILEQRNTLNNLFNAFTGWNRTQQDWISDRITDVNTDMRAAKTYLEGISNWGDSIKAIEAAQTKAASTTQPAAIQINIGGSVIGVQDIVDALSKKFGSALSLQGVSV